jgi:Tol biopolymer transport system component
VRVAGRPAVVLAAVALVLLALLAIALAVAGRRPAPPPFGPAGNGLMAFESSGQILTADADGSLRVRLGDLDTDRHSPSWSPDGRWLAYWSQPAAGAIGLSVLDDQRSRTIEIRLDGLVPEAWVPAEWSPDSQHLVFAATDGGRPGLYVTDIRTGSTNALPDESLQPSHPTWSPGGQWLAFYGSSPETFHIGVYIVHPDGTGLQLLPTSTVPTAVSDYGSARWSPDPRAALLAYAYNANAVGDIAVFDVASGREAIVSAEVTNEFWPTWSPDGRSVAWLYAADPAEVRAVDVLPGPKVSAIRPLLISPRAAPEDGSNCADNPSLAGRMICQPPQWSPDGRSIYAADVLGTQVMVVPVDRSLPTRTFPVPLAGWISWQRVAP